MAWFVPHENLRIWAGVNGQHVADGQMNIMKDTLRQAMKAGAVGLSSGIELVPGRSVDPQEIDRLLEVVSEYDGVYSSHIRNRDEFILDAVEEYLAALGKAHVRGAISHFNVRQNTNAPHMGWERAIQRMERARNEGLNVLGEMTPFPYGSGSMEAILPPWIMKDGRAEAAKRLADPGIRRRLRSECDRYWRFIAKGEWDRVWILSNYAHPELNGLSVTDAAGLMSLDEWDCFFQLLSDSGEMMAGDLMIGRLYSEEHMLQKIAQPQFMLTVDGTSIDLDNEELIRDQGYFCLNYMGMVCYFTRYVRERKAISIEECVRRMTGLPASHYHFKNRGILREGAFADINVFDLENLQENSSLADPLHYASGFDYVFVNGVPVLDKGEHTGARPGRLIHCD